MFELSGLEKGLADKTFKSKSSKTGFKSGLKSKSGLEYYKFGPKQYL